jgi:hypothetical protein
MNSISLYGLVIEQRIHIMFEKVFQINQPQTIFPYYFQCVFIIFVRVCKNGDDC